MPILPFAVFEVFLKQVNLPLQPFNVGGELCDFGVDAVHILLLTFNLGVDDLQVGELRANVLFGGFQQAFLVGYFFFECFLLALQFPDLLVGLRFEGTQRQQKNEEEEEKTHERWRREAAFEDD